MDVEELPQALNPGEPARNVVNQPHPEGLPEAGAAYPDCAPANCRRRCALEAIDSLLGRPHPAVSGEEVDLLLDLRWQLRQRTAAEPTLQLFCDLRRRMEGRHYLAFFRIRRWLENHLVAAVQVCPAAEPRLVAVRLDHYCVEAIRRVCLCASLGDGSVLLVPRLRFEFRLPPAAVATRVAVEGLAPSQV